MREDRLQAISELYRVERMYTTSQLGKYIIMIEYFKFRHFVIPKIGVYEFYVFAGLNFFYCL